MVSPSLWRAQAFLGLAFRVALSGPADDFVGSIHGINPENSEAPMTFTSSGWHRLARSGETPEQTVARVRRIRTEAMEREILGEFDRQNGHGAGR